MNKRETFLKTYTEKQKIFPHAEVYQPFGLGTQNGEIFLSMGTYFKRDKSFYYDTFAPFNFEQVDYSDKLNMITLHSLEFQFSIRIYFVKSQFISKSFLDSYINKKEILQKTLIGKNGKLLNCSHTFFTYIELYTETESSLLFELTPSKAKNFTDDFLYNYYVVNCLDLKKTSERLLDLHKKKSIEHMNSLFCYKYDKIKEKNLFFFSYNALF